MQDEITKHTKKIFHTMKHEKFTLGEKVKEIIIEVGIIVFAVSLSIWLHGWSEHRHQQEEVHQFLVGLKSDLNATIESAQGAGDIYKKAETRFLFLSKLSSKQKSNSDSLNIYFNEYQLSPNFQSNASRYEGFKSSGKIGLIENEVLQQGILNFYQQDLPTYYTTTNAWNNQRHTLHDFVTDNLVENENGTDNRFQVLTMPKAHNLCKNLIPWPQLFERNETIIENATLLIAEIDKVIKE
ncbi:hypothetical protein [Flavobacterium sp.]|uniref:hypothetical protein n=1 Tax=Flavobacterium sp. TaxID=239 RepID=UPI0026163A61|nr:hypothetical protein [Flavobacterium sp.]